MNESPLIPDQEEKYNDYIKRILLSRPNYRIENVYQERHHIIPKCQGGTNDENNLIYLFPEEHYYAHKLLAIENPDNIKLQYPWWKMSNQFKDLISAEEYAQSRINFSKTQQGKIISQEQRKKISKKQKERYANGVQHPFLGRTHSSETKEKISKNHIDVSGENNPNFGKHMTEESKQKLAKKNSEHFKGEGNPFFGKHHSEETKEKISQKNKGRKFSQEVRQQMSSSRTGEKSHRAKKVLCEETNEIFISVKEASEQKRIDKSSIAACCRGEYSQAGGYHWSYYNKEANNVG